MMQTNKNLGVVQSINFSKPKYDQQTSWDYTILTDTNCISIHITNEDKYENVIGDLNSLVGQELSMSLKTVFGGFYNYYVLFLNDIRVQYKLYNHGISNDNVWYEVCPLEVKVDGYIDIYEEQYDWMYHKKAS